MESARALAKEPDEGEKAQRGHRADQDRRRRLARSPLRESLVCSAPETLKAERKRQQSKKQNPQEQVGGEAQDDGARQPEDVHGSRARRSDFSRGVLSSPTSRGGSDK